MLPFSQEQLRLLLEYCPDDGTFMWLPRGGKSRADEAFNGQFAGRKALTCTGVNGYKEGTICRTRVLAHRVAWKYFYGNEPNQIDHINGNRADNRITNLRAASQSVNSRNSSLSTRNTSGIIGVCWCQQRKLWVAQIRADGIQHNLGRFQSFELACAVRKEAEARLGFHPNHGRKRAA